MDLEDPLKALQTIPGVGPRLSRMLVDLGIEKVEDLSGEDPEAMYERLCTVRGGHVDRCVLYVFRCAVYFAGRREHDPELLKWWRWKDPPPEGRSRDRTARRS